MERIGQILIAVCTRKLSAQLGWLITLLLVFPSFSYGQTFPVDANAILIPPHSLNISDYQVEKSQDLMVNLTLNDPIEPFWDVQFRITVQNNGVDILQTSPSFQPPPYRLNQFSTVMLTGFELSEYLSLNNLMGMNGYTNTGTLPEGLNSICIEVLDYNRPDVLLSQKACGSGYAILNDPPFTQLPFCGEDVPFQDAQNIVFTWLPMHLGSPNPVTDVQYNFRIVRVESGYNIFEAMEAALPIHEETTRNTTIVLQDPILEPGFTYAWQVQAVDGFDGSELNSFKNQGYSVVCSFNYMEHVVDLSELYADEENTQCGASCATDIPSNSETITDLAVGDVVQVGKFFMNVTEISNASGGFYKGKGFVFIPFLLSNMNVTFEDLTVNTDGVMFSGDVVTDIDSDLLNDNYSDTEGDMVISGDEIVAIDDYVKSENRRVSEVEQGSSLGLPLALDNTIAGVTQDLIITGISFEKDIAYLNAVMTFGTQERGDHIAFGAKGICFHPFGIGRGTAELALYEDFSLGAYSDFDLTFKAPGDGNDGTYLTFDCTGFQELNVEGEYEFPSDMLVAADGSGEPVTATFNFTTHEWGEFIAELEMDPFEVYDVEGYTFTLESAFLDFSDVANPDNISFPDDYDDTGDDWKGFYLSTMSLTLPEDLAQASGDLSFGVQNLIIDHSGVSGNIFAAEVLQLDNGRLGEWAFSIDTVQIDFVSNTLTEGNLLGQVHVPILDEENSLNYGAAMTKTDEGIDLLFNIQTEEDVSVSMWAAEMSLSNASVIAIEKTSDGFKPYAELHGDLTLDVEIQEGNAFEVEAMSFEGLKINHPDESKRLTVDAFSLFGGGSGFGGDDEGGEAEEEGDDQESLSGFPVSFSNVSFVEGSGSEAGINFDLNLNLTGDDLGVGATGNLTVNGQYNASAAPFNAWKFQGVELSSLEVDADVAAGSIQGSLEIYKGDETYGSGFKGLIGAQFTGVGRVDALAQFGKVDGYRYFFVDAMLLSSTPFVDILGVGLYGFAGGMYHHMSRDNTDPAMNLDAGTLYAEPSQLGASLSGVVYTPNKNTLLGLKAGLTMGIAPGTAFSADASFEASFGLSNGVPSIESVALGGKAYMMSPGSILEREDSRIIGQFDANLNLSDINDPIFTATAQMTLDTDVISGSGSAAMKLSKRESYMWIGTPNNPISVSVLDMGTFNMYADMGDRVPAMPSIADVVPNYTGNVVDQRPADLGGTKVIFGASFGMDRQEFNYGSFYASAEFGLGFDAYLRQVNAADCGVARGNIGIDNWYLSGQAYAYGSGNVGLKVKTWFYSGNINILDLSASMVMQAELPNPTWISGDVDIRYSVLSGAIKGSVDYNFEIGEKCNFEENLVSGLAVLADISPENGERGVYTFSSPTAICNIPVNEILEFEEIGDDGDVTTWQYMPYVFNPQTTLKKTNGANVNYNLQIQDDGELIVLSPSSMLEAYTSYTATIAVKWKKRKKGVSRWTFFMRDEEPERLSVTYTTGDKPEFIPEEAVAYSFPLANRRNIYDVEVNQRWYVFMKTKEWGYLMEDDDYDYKFIVTNMSTGERRTRNAYYSEPSNFGVGKIYTARSSGRILNNWINESNGDMFKVELKAIYNIEVPEFDSDQETDTDDQGVTITNKSLEGVNTGDFDTEKVFRTWYFRMSDFDTPQQKIARYKQNRRFVGNSYRAYRVNGNKSYVSYGSFANSSEGLDNWDLNDRTYYVGTKQVQRIGIIRQHRTNFNAPGSISNKMLNRYITVRDESFAIWHAPYKKSMVDDNFWDKGDIWRDDHNAKFNLSGWDIFGARSEWVTFFTRGSKEELTAAEKVSGNADNGVSSQYSNEFIGFRYKPQEFNNSLYGKMYSRRSLLRDNNYWYNFAAGWNPSVDFSKEVFMFGIRNWDADPDLLTSDVEFDIAYKTIDD